MTATAPLSASPAHLPGWIDTYYRTHKGKRLGPYHVRKWRIGKKIKREYIKAKDLERIKAACIANKERRQEQTAARRRICRSVENFNFLCAMMFRMDRRRPLHQEQKEHIVRISRRAQLGDSTIYTVEKPRLRIRSRRFGITREQALAYLRNMAEQVRDQVFGNPTVYGSTLCVNGVRPRP